MERHFLASFELAAATRPTDTAFVYYTGPREPHTLSYQELAGVVAERSRRLSVELPAGAFAFILHHDALEQACWWLGALHAGLVPCVMTPPTPKLDRARYYADLAKTMASYPGAKVVVDPSVCAAEEARFLLPHCLRLEERPRAAPARSEGLPPAAPRGDSPLLFQQSSGTTGLRKGVLLSERAVIDQLEAYSAAIRLVSTDRLVGWVPFYHDLGLIAVLGQAIYFAVPLVFTSPFVWLADVDWLPRAIAAHQATLSWLPNFAFDLMAERSRLTPADGAPYRSLRALISTSEVVLASSLDKFVARFGAHGIRADQIATSYALAENVFAVSQSTAPPVRETIRRQALESDGVAELTDGDLEVVSSGQALRNASVRIVRDGAPATDGAVGEIHVRSDCLMSGYLGVGSSEQPVSDGWMATGDLGYLRRGELFVIGRIKDVIVRGGRNINALDVETAVTESVADIKPGRVAAVGVPNADEGTEDLVVLAEFGGSRVTDLDAVRGDVFRSVTELLGVAPQAVEVLRGGWLVKSSSGKLARRACRDKYIAMLAQREAAVINAYEHGEDDLPDEIKDAFGTFGSYSRIGMPTEIRYPRGIHVGNWVSLGRFGKLYLLYDLSAALHVIAQHYPDVALDVDALDPRIYGRRSPRLKIGDGTTIGDYFHIVAGDSITIGKHVMISARVFISDTTHRHEDPDLPICLQSNTVGTPMVIGDHSWIGVGACLLEGAQIGKGCVVGANAVVNFPVPDRAVVAGNPGRVVRILGRDEATERAEGTPPRAPDAVAASPDAVVAMVQAYVREKKGLVVEPGDSLFRSGVVDSLETLGLLEHLESSLRVSIDGTRFAAERPDTARDVAHALRVCLR